MRPATDHAVSDADPEQSQDGYRVGDIVTMSGHDRHRVIRVICLDLIEVECLADCWFAKAGESEVNLSRRYSYPDDLTIEGAPMPKPLQQI